jgi:hypothetical protein
MARKKFEHKVQSTPTSDHVGTATSDCNRLIRDYTSDGWEVVDIFYAPLVTPHITLFAFSVHLKRPLEVPTP